MNYFKELHTPFIVNQPSYSMLNRWIESDGLDNFAAENGIGLAVFSPLYQGFLTEKYLYGIPADSRVGKGETWIGNQLDDNMIERLNKLNRVAQSRGQKLSQLALSWVLHNKAVTTVLIGASRPEQIVEKQSVLRKLNFQLTIQPD
jgi:L-glyceraldehyde 3-phosphate reductase